MKEYIPIEIRVMNLKEPMDLILFVPTAGFGKHDFNFCGVDFESLAKMVESEISQTEEAEE